MHYTRAVNQVEVLSAAPFPYVADPRQTSLVVHNYLRQLIMSGKFPPGMELKQTEIARALGVSRTPMREAFRMLQEEGLIDAELNQRAKVKDFDPSELDSLYAARISLECLGAAITSGTLTPAEVRQAEQALREMARTGRARDLDGWSHAHRTFHAILVVRVAPHVGRTIASYETQTERYRRLYGIAHPSTFDSRHAEHEELLAAARLSAPENVVKLLSRHLARTAKDVLRDFDAGYEALAVNTALRLVDCSP